MDLEDVEYYYKERRVDFERLMKTYKIIKESYEKINKKYSKNEFETNLNIRKISEKIKLSKRTVRKKLEELKDLGVINYILSGSEKIIYFVKCEESSFLDEMLKKAEKENLL